MTLNDFHPSYVPVRERIHPVKSSHEPGMKITYDATSQRVVVAFRGRITVLPETYGNEEVGLKAGEAFCRRQGWNPEDPSHPRTRIIKSWT